MFRIKINNIIQMQNDNLNDIIVNFNKILSIINETEKKEKYVIKNNDSQNVIIELEFDNKNIKLESDNPITLSYEMIHLFPFFIFHKNTLINMDDNDLLLITKLNTQLLLDVFAYDKLLLDPFYILSNIFHVPNDCIYQIFVLYLNKTISINHELSQFNMDIIIDNFINNNIYTKKLKFENLLMYYVSSKKILPFRIKYQKYVSKFN